MAEPEKKSATDPEEEPKKDPAPEELGDAGKKALDAERKARKAAEKSAKDLEARLKEIEDKDKSESDKLREEREAAVAERDAARLELLRLKVAGDKGLTPAQAKRLVGTTEEELEADADEFLESIKPAESKGAPPGKPREALRSGGDPTEEPEETDPRKLAAQISRPI